MRIKWDSLDLSGSDKVEVYRNLRRRCWSVRSNKTGKVIDHVTLVALEDCELVVRKAGREKVRREGVKNVHAFIKGYMITPDTYNVNQLGSMITYNPYEDESFRTIKNNEPIKKAKQVFLTSNGRAYAKGAE